MHFENELTRSLGIRHPLVMAPMFLISNEAMVKAAMSAGILGCFPSLNYREPEKLDALLHSLNDFRANLPANHGAYGVNLIVQKTNIWLEKHLAICVERKVPVYITSLGNPKDVIAAAHSYGAKVLCDVTNLEHAKKCYELGCDGFIAVGQGAGGHAGPFPVSLLIRSLRKHFPDKPVMAAGGISDGHGILSALAAGASAAYCGTRFIASYESSVSDEYIKAIIESGMEDIVLTDRISGTPCTIINTPYAQKIGIHQNRLERYLSKNPKTKKIFKMLVQKRGWNWLEKALVPGSYQNLWCAGQSVELIENSKPIQDIVTEMITDLERAYVELSGMHRN